MIEQDVVMTTRHGRMPAYAACPDMDGPFPPIIFYMDAPGTRQELRNMARRIAKQGFFCLLPDMYYRLGTIRFDIPRRDNAMSGVIRAALDARDNVKTGPVGCVGHCLSGCYITTVAGASPCHSRVTFRSGESRRGAQRENI